MLILEHNIHVQLHFGVELSLLHMERLEEWKLDLLALGS